MTLFPPLTSPRFTSLLFKISPSLTKFAPLTHLLTVQLLTQLHLFLPTTASTTISNTQSKQGLVPYFSNPISPTHPSQSIMTSQTALTNLENHLNSLQLPPEISILIKPLLKAYQQRNEASERYSSALKESDTARKAHAVAMQKEEERLTACDKSDTIRMINKRAATLCRQNKKIKELEEQTKVLKAELEVAEATVEEYRNEIERLERVNLVEDNEAPGQKVREKEH
jgi:hypothetical protein